MGTNELPITVSLPEFGAAAYGLGAYGSYEAGKTGVISTIEVQGKKRVPVRAELHKLANGNAEVFEALARDFLARLRALLSDSQAPAEGFSEPERPRPSHQEKKEKGRLP